MKKNVEQSLFSRKAAPEPQQCCCEEEVAAYAVDELTGPEKTACEQHLRTCSTCRRRAESFRRVAGLLRANAPCGESRDMTAAVLMRIPASAWTVGDDTAGAWARRRFPVRLAAAAALFLALATGAGLFTFSGRWQSPEAPVAAKSADAVQEALRWLASVQEPGGAWDPRPWSGRQAYEAGLTGMALLAFLRHEESRPAMAGETMERAVAHLLSCQQPDGAFSSMRTGLMYNHGIAAVALLEAYRQGLAPGTEAELRKALDFICEQQHDGGGWGYESHPLSRPNTSITIWQMEALALGMAIDEHRVAASLKKGLDWLEAMANEEGQFGYQAPGGSDAHSALSAMGAYGLFKTAGQVSQDSARQKAVAKKALNRVADQVCSESADLDFYQSYFVVSALKYSPKTAHRQSLASLRSRLQEKRNVRTAYAGTWDPSDRWGPVGGRLYATSMAALALE